MTYNQKSRKSEFSRKDFLKMTALAAGAVLMPRGIGRKLGDFPVSDRLGRIAGGMVDIKPRPDYYAPNIGRYYEDTVVPWLREVVGSWPWRNNQRWVETEDGYIWGPNVQPVKNEPNQPREEFPDGTEGMWVEVTVPWVNATLDNPPPRSTWWKLQTQKNLPPRFYYMQVFWVDMIEKGVDGNIWYRINERFGPGDLFWAPAEAFRPITEDEMAPISPEIEDKQIVVDVTPSRQTLSCFEEGREVYFCRISSGKEPYPTKLSSPDSAGFNIWRKLHSIQMAAGSSEAGWMIPGIGWTSLFQGTGVAIHSTYWHNNFGEPSSHGCINAAPDDAKWIFRWTSPITPFQEGDITVAGKIGTPVKIIEY
ncbi:MAG: hypothetical protein DRI65_00215 [Chloroflexota bacterium]|nr:MAG: hypothetical protein DRI65_00215 [Chloroflexota bacterium]